MDKVNSLPLIICGTVVRGKQLGRKLGFPTINLVWDGRADLTYGVYASLVTAGGRSFYGVTNVGEHPTLPEGSMTVETHLLGAKIDLYDEQVEIKLLAFLRPEKCFKNAEELKTQIAEDIVTAEAVFCNNGEQRI